MPSLCSLYENRLPRDPKKTQVMAEWNWGMTSQSAMKKSWKRNQLRLRHGEGTRFIDFISLPVDRSTRPTLPLALVEVDAQLHSNHQGSWADPVHKHLNVQSFQEPKMSWRSYGIIFLAWNLVTTHHALTMAKPRWIKASQSPGSGASGPGWRLQPSAGARPYSWEPRGSGCVGKKPKTSQ